MAATEVAAPVIETYMQYAHPAFDWHAHYEKLDQQTIDQYNDPAVKSAAIAGKQVGKEVRKFIPQALLLFLSHKMPGKTTGIPPTSAMPQPIAVSANGTAIAVEQVVVNGLEAATQKAKIGISTATGDGPENTGGSSTSSDVKTDQKNIQEAPQKEAEKQDQALGKNGLPLDKRLWTAEQIAADEARKAQGRAIRERGREFENFLQKQFGGKGSFKAKGTTDSREFDGAHGNVFYEAKSGEFWDGLLSSKDKLGEFKNDMGRGLKVSKDCGASYELHSNTPIPQIIKEWLTEKGIKFYEWL